VIVNVRSKETTEPAQKSSGGMVSAVASGRASPQFSSIARLTSQTVERMLDANYCLTLDYLYRKRYIN